jgi:hypothetical protein
MIGGNDLRAVAAVKTGQHHALLLKVWGIFNNQ